MYCKRKRRQPLKKTLFGNDRAKDRPPLAGGPNYKAASMLLKDLAQLALALSILIVAAGNYQFHNGNISDDVALFLLQTITQLSRRQKVEKTCH